MRLGDLPAECEPDPGTVRLRREEGHEEVRRVGQTRPFILDQHDDRGLVDRPRYTHPATRVGRGLHGVHGVPDDVDEELIELVAIGEDGRRWTRTERHWHALLQLDDSTQPPLHIDRTKHGLWQLSETCIRLEKPAERSRTSLDDVEAVQSLVLPVGGPRLTLEHALQAPRDRLDR